MNINYSLTKHAQTRSQQRGISNKTIDLVLQYGKEFNAGGGSYKYVICKKLLKASWIDPSTKKHLVDICGCYVVLSNDGSIVTVGHHYKSLH